MTQSKGGPAIRRPGPAGYRPVHAPGAGGGTWPTPQQEMLLRASLLRGSEAVDAWKRWTAAVDFERIDLASQRLLPLAYHNLRALGVTELGIDRVKGIYRRAWYSNQMLFRRVVPVLQAFHEAGLQTLLLKGAALIQGYFNDCGLRPMNDFDVLVPREQATAAVGLLADLGWRPKWRPIATFREPLFSVINGHEFFDRDLRALDLHWHVLSQCCYEGADDDFWEGAQKTDFRGVRTHVMMAEDALLHVCLHGLKWNPDSLVRWIADAMTILNACQGKIDWERLVAQARKRLLLLPLRDALLYLRQTLGAPIPLGVLDSIEALPASAVERVEHRVRMSPRWALGGMPLLWFQHWRYARLSRSLGSGNQRIGFMTFLQHTWGLSSSWHVPRYVVGEGLRRVRTLARAVLRSAGHELSGRVDHPAATE